MGVRFGMPAAPSRDTEVFAGLTSAAVDGILVVNLYGGNTHGAETAKNVAALIFDLAGRACIAETSRDGLSAYSCRKFWKLLYILL